MESSRKGRGCRMEGEIEVPGREPVGSSPATRVQASEPGRVRSQALVRWGRAARPQRRPIVAEAAASSAAPRGPGAPAPWRWRWRWQWRCQRQQPASHTLPAPGPGGRSVGLGQVTWGRGLAAWEPGKAAELEGSVARGIVGLAARTY